MPSAHSFITPVFAHLLSNKHNGVFYTVSKLILVLLPAPSQGHLLQPVPGLLCFLPWLLCNIHHSRFSVFVFCSCLPLTLSLLLHVWSPLLLINCIFVLLSSSQNAKRVMGKRKYEFYSTSLPIIFFRYCLLWWTHTHHFCYPFWWLSIVTCTEMPWTSQKASSISLLFWL